MFLGESPVLHMIDLNTNYCAASFSKKQSSAEIWKEIKNEWFLTYSGLPNLPTVDQGSAYVSREMKYNLDDTGVQLLEAPIENPGTIGTVEITTLHSAQPTKRYEKNKTANKLTRNAFKWKSFSSIERSAQRYYAQYCWSSEPYQGRKGQFLLTFI